ncbi:MAG: XdhC family protein [Oscillospiraceae bacterium]|nr:XdhC family protein [Oscillospiraceae bacterium]
MTNLDFQEILDGLSRGETPRLTRTLEGRSYTRVFLPENRLILLGGGHIAQPLCAMAAMLDFAVTVVDDRITFANSERFPRAAQVVCNSFGKAIAGLQVRAGDYVCVITRGHRWDGECLRQLLSGTFPTYLGMIGSRRRVKGLLDLLAEEGFDAEKLARIHAPIGLAINAQTPAEIAVSICAELVAHRRAYVRKDRDITLDQTNTDYTMLRFLAESTGPKACALVLSSTGSTPVKSGAIMGIDYLGRGYGTIGGGCSEAAVMSRARKLMGTGGSCLVEVDMTNEVAESEGMVCGGTMRVLLEDVSRIK